MRGELCALTLPRDFVLETEPWRDDRVSPPSRPTEDLLSAFMMPLQPAERSARSYTG